MVTHIYVYVHTHSINRWLKEEEMVCVVIC